MKINYYSVYPTSLFFYVVLSNKKLINVFVDKLCTTTDSVVVAVCDSSD